MKELDFLEIIKKTLNFSSFLGDDCAFLEDLDIFVTQDTLVEDVHFSMYTTSPYLLGRKSVNVNLSDLAAALALPKYISVSVSLPKKTKDSFVSELYRGINDVCNEYNVKVTGGDITGSDKIVISITAIGKKTSLFLSSRKNAKKNDYILVTGEFGSSSAGLYALSNFLYADKNLIDSHLNPAARINESKKLANFIESDITVMDCSDGLVDALYKISSASRHCLKVDINSVPVNQKLLEFCSQNDLNYKKFVKWGGEDYELLICADEKTYLKLDKKIFKCIGRVQNKDTYP
ncbi:MAG: thiamine-phosphate kinase, partial [Candidatus Gastranaerophilales bacterium]|nr:thiamine-phosphate kinase [Candidatus Gastranaerophilales bacterium]